MAHLTFERKTKVKIYLIAALVLCTLFIFTACNNDSATINMADGVKEPTHFIAKFLMILNDGIGNFGWTVVAFTVILKLITTPFDFWQKYIMRKNAKIMERIKPQLDSLAEKCGDDKQRYQQEQMALYKREKYSTFGACLPMIITLVVFFVVFAGFREMVSYQNGLVYENARNVYYATYDVEYEKNYIAEMNKLGFSEEQIAEIENYDLTGTLTEEQKGNLIKASSCDAIAHAKAVDISQTAVKNNYKPQKFLWIHNIFVQDSWVKAVPDYLTFSGQSGVANSKIEGVMVTEYNTVMAKVLGTNGYGKEGKWNGLLIFPILSIGLSVVSQLLMTKAQGKQPKQPNGMTGNSNKMVQWMMPILSGVFALLYSSAFTIYIFVSTLYSVLFQLSFNLVAMLVDKKKEKEYLGNRR